MKKKLLLTLICINCLLVTLFAQTGTWSRVKASAPHRNEGVCLLMTDGTVICHNIHGGSYGTGWDRLTPDIHGSYANGTWDSIPSMMNDRLFFSTQVLPSGQVYVAGGEYGPGGTAGEVYDPVAKTWTACNGLPGGWNIYDGNSELLYNGSVLEGPQIGAMPSFDCLFWTPSTNLYTIAPTALLNHDEAAWLKLPDSSVLFIGIANDSSNRFIPQINTWVKDGVVPGYLYDGLEEAGGAFMLPNGKAFFLGATGANAIYTPTGNSSPGTWVLADSCPVIQGCRVGQSDASSAMLVNGHILCAVAPTDACKGSFAPPCYFLEYDYTTDTFTQVHDSIPGMKGNDSIPIPSYQTQMVDLPDGSVLVSVSQTSSYSNTYLIYTPGSGPIPQGKPTLDSYTQLSCNNYMVTGKLFNGISEGASYGDDWQAATNFPIVRLTKGSDVYYAKTSNWNRIGAVQTDSAEDTAYFTLPSLPGGTYSMVVVANGFASSPMTLSTFGDSVASLVNVTCNGGNNGSASVIASDGALPYTYSWAPGGQTTTAVSGLSAGIYTVTVTENGGCTSTISVTITQPAALNVTANITSGIHCYGNYTGGASSKVSGGTKSYTFSWSPGGATSTNITGLSAGSYTVSVTDSCGNTATASVSITQPAALSVSANTIENEFCINDSTGYVTSTATGGTGTYTYSWAPNSATVSSVSGLPAGLYTVTVKDSCGATATATTMITEPAPMVLKTDSVRASSGCNGEAIITVISGGTKPYRYLWSPGGQTTDTVKNLCSGPYCCTVTDSNGCTKSVCLEVVTGINNLSSGSGDITIYPVPNQGIFTIAFGSPVAGLQTIEIYNMMGQVVYMNRLTITNSKVSIDLSDKSSGIYMCRILSENGSLTGEAKIIIDK